MKAPVFLLLCLPFFIYAQDNPYKRNHDEFFYRDKIIQLEKLSEALKNLYETLRTNSAEVHKLNLDATKKLNDELYDAYVETSVNLVDKLYTPLGSVLDIAVSSLMEIALDDPNWAKSIRKNNFVELNNSANYRNTKLRLMYETLAKIIKHPLKRFDDDMQPLPFTKSWWKTGDGADDDEKELKIRKLNLLVNLSKFVYEKTEEELNKIISERRVVVDEINFSKTEYEKYKQANIDAGVNTNALANRVVKSRGYGVGDERGGEGHEGPQNILEENYSNDPPEIKAEVQKYLEAKKENEEAIKAREEANKKSAEDYRKKLASAEVYIDADCSRYVYPLERALMLAKAYPEDIEGTFKLTIDDKQISTSREKKNYHEFYYMFTKPGVYDIQVQLFVDNKYIDTYTDQWYVEEIIPDAGSLPFPVYAKDNRPKYDPGLEGTKKSAMKNQYVNYDLLYEGGDIYLTGYYFTPTGQKVNYKSKPLAAALEQAPASGLMLTKGGTGYHFYQTIGETANGTPYVITRLRGTEISVLHEFRAYYVSVKTAPDYSSYTVEYKTEPNGPVKTFLLD